MTNPEIPEEAVEAAHSAWRAEMLEHGLPRTAVGAALAAALPHLRVQETPVLAALAELVDLHDGDRGEDYETRKPQAWEAARAALLATPHPRPVVDREAVINAIASQLPEEVWDDQVAADAAAAVLSLLPTEEGEGS